MRVVPVTAQDQQAASVLPQLEPVLREQRTLADVLAWGRRQEPPRTVTEIVTQDEYTHDVVVQYGEQVYLVFDTT